MEIVKAGDHAAPLTQAGGGTNPLTAHGNKLLGKLFVRERARTVPVATSTSGRIDIRYGEGALDRAIQFAQRTCRTERHRRHERVRGGVRVAA
jgi:hypothetical protein